VVVDKGGLQYTIRIDDEFSVALDRFTQGIKKARAELDALRGASAGLRSTAAAVREIATASKEAAAASRGRARRETRDSTIRQEALRRENRLHREQQISIERANVAAQRRFATARRELTTNQRLLRSHKAITKVLDERGRREDILAAAKARGVRLTNQELLANKLLTGTTRKLIAAKEKLRAVQSETSNRALRGINAEIEAVKRRTRADKEAAVQDLLRQRGRTRTGALAAPAQTAQRQGRLLTRFTGILKKSRLEANRVSFTFRRLFGILAAFAAARAVVRGFRSLISELIRFNASIEQATLGVAALFLAVGDVRDALGETTTSAQGLAIAQKEARRQIALMRVDALKTAATFEQLLQTFQVAVAPGFQAGLDIEEIRKFTLDISRAASAIGLQQNQLAEEIRSILSATIQARTTRIAVALGITNEDIRNAKEAGVLVDFLQDRFKAFEAAGEEALKTFNALFTNLKGAIQLVLETGGAEFFVAIKDTLKELFELLTDQDPISGLLTPDPSAVSILRTFSNSLRDALGIAKQVGQSLTFPELQASATAIGRAIEAIVFGIANLVKGAIIGIRDLAVTIKAVGIITQRIFGDVALFNTENLAEVIVLATRIVTVFLGITAAMAVANLALKSMVVVMGVLSGVTRIWAGILFVVRRTMLLIDIISKSIALAPALVVAGVVAIVAALIVGLALLKDWADEITGIDLKFGSVLAVLVAKLDQLRQKAIERIALFIGQTFAKIKSGLINALTGVLVAISTKIQVFLVGLDKLPFIETAGAIEALVEATDKLQQGIGARELQLTSDLAFMAMQYETAKKRLDEAFKAELEGIAFTDQNRRSLKEIIFEIVSEVGGNAKKLLLSILDDLDIDLAKLFADLIPEDSIDTAAKLTDEFERQSGIIAQNRKGLADQGALLKELKDNAIAARNALEISTATLGVENASIRTAILKSNQRLEKEALFLVQQRTDLELRLLGLQANQASNKAKIENLSAKELQAQIETEIFLREILSLDKERAELSTKIALDDAKRKKAILDGEAEKAKGFALSIASAEEDLQFTEEQLIRFRDLTNAVEERVGLTKEEAIRSRAATLNRIQLEGEVKVVTEQITDSRRDQLDLEQALNLVLAERIKKLAQVQIFASLERARELRSELVLLAAEETSRVALNNAKARTAVAQAELQVLQAEIEVAEGLREKGLQQQVKNIADLTAKLQTVASRLEDPSLVEAETNALLQEQVVLRQALAAAQLLEAQLKQENHDAGELELLQLNRAVALLQQITAQEETPIFQGLTEGLQDFIKEAQDTFTTFRDIVQNSFEQLADLLAGTIVNALTGQEADFKQALGRLLASIAQQIIAMFIKLAIAKAILGLGFLGGQGGGAVPNISGLGFLKGGLIHKVVMDSPFGKAKGFQRGGFATGPVQQTRTSAVRRIVASFRPPNVDPRDTVPIWTQPGEWVVQKKAVDRYGADVMGRINDLLIDPASLRAIAGVNSRGGTSSRISGAAQQGGAITESSGAPTAEITTGESSGPVVAIVAGNDETMQQMLAGGGNALLDFLRENRDEFLGQERAPI